MTTNWNKGKYAGSIQVQRIVCKVIFSVTYNIPVREFVISEYSSLTAAINAAEEYQKEQSNHLGLTKNKYRIVTDESGGAYVEVQLQNDLIMKCDIEHIPLVEERVWTGNKAVGKYTYYAKSRESKRRNQSYGLFHRLAFPDIVECDHINREGLDNRSCNIREGSGRTNPNNKRKAKNNKSGVKGVFYEGGQKPRWRAQWIDIDGKKRTKSFACAKYKEEAFQKACDWRAEQHQSVIEGLGIDI